MPATIAVAPVITCASDYFDHALPAEIYCHDRDADYEQVLQALNFKAHTANGLQASLYDLSVYVDLRSHVNPATPRIEVAVTRNGQLDIVGRTRTLTQVVAYILAAYW